MPYSRKATQQLSHWIQNQNPKPLIIRGARQVGKTTLVELLSKQFDQRLTFNLEEQPDREIFRQNSSFQNLLQSLFLSRNLTQNPNQKTILFIDEIQESEHAIASLRFFYEKPTPGLWVVAAGSLLENLLHTKLTIPVGRVEYFFLHPLSFEEFLQVTKQEPLLQAWHRIPCPPAAHQPLLQAFHQYSLIGGMPEVVARYAENHDIIHLQKTYESLLVSYQEDAEKYAHSHSQQRLIQYIIEQAPLAAASRITFQGFGHSNYRSRDVSEAFRLLEKTMVLKLVYPTTSELLPALPDIKKSPKLFFLDTGLVNYVAGWQKNVLQANDLNKLYQGRLVEQLVYQELNVVNQTPLRRLNFWVREKHGASSQVDFVIPHEGYVFPLEVKSGKAGRLRSLHQFIDRAPHPFGIRIHGGGLSIEQAQTIAGKPFTLFNLPYYLTGKMYGYIQHLLDQKSNFSNHFH